MHRPTNPSTLRLKIHWCNNNKLLYYHPIINLSLDQSLTPNLTLDLSAGETIYGTAQFLGKFSPYFSPHFCLLGETHLVRPVIAALLEPEARSKSRTDASRLPYILRHQQLGI